MEACLDLQGCAIDYEGIVLGVGEVQSVGMAKTPQSEWACISQPAKAFFSRLIIQGQSSGCSTPGHIQHEIELLSTAGAHGAVSQWLFLTDDSVRSAEGCIEPSLVPHFLAVQLQAHPEAIDFLSPAADVGLVASLR